MKVREIMTEPVLSCTPETWLAQAARTMRSGDCGILPVLDTDRRVIGVLTDRDVCLAVAASNRSPRAIAVHEVMTHKVVIAHVDDDVRTALLEMKRAKVRRLPVVNERQRAVGLLSLEDVLLRGLQDANGVNSADLLDTLRALYERLPALRPAASDALGG